MKPLNSSVVIAKLLCSEGFTPYLANQIERYWKRSSKLSKVERKNLEKLDKSLTNICKDMSKKDKMVIGKFVGLHKKMSFQTGLKIGIQAFAVKENKIFEEEEE